MCFQASSAFVDFCSRFVLLVLYCREAYAYCLSSQQEHHFCQRLGKLLGKLEGLLRTILHHSLLQQRFQPALTC